MENTKKWWFKKRLLIATDSFMPRWDGIARFLKEIIPRLKDDFDITVVAPDFGNYQDPTIRLVKIPVLKFLKFGDFNPAKPAVFKIKKLVRKSNIVFSQTIGPIGALAITYGKKFRKPVVTYKHSIEWELFPKAISQNILKKYSYPLIKKMTKYLYNRCTVIIVPSEGIGDSLLWKDIHTKTEVVHLGTDTEKFKPPESKADAKKAIGLNPADFIIGYHGRIGREKDLLTLVRAFIRIRMRHKNAKLLIVGEGVKDVTDALKSKDGVIMVGSKDNVVPYLQAMDVYCLTSLTETTSLSTLEAMSCALPVIATEVGFVKDYIRNGYNGLFFRVRESYQLAAHIDSLVNDEKARRRLGENARKTIIEKFRWEETAEKIIKILEKV